MNRQAIPVPDFTASVPLLLSEFSSMSRSGVSLASGHEGCGWWCDSQLNAWIELNHSRTFSSSANYRQQVNWRAFERNKAHHLHILEIHLSFSFIVLKFWLFLASTYSCPLTYFLFKVPFIFLCACTSLHCWTPFCKGVFVNGTWCALAYSLHVESQHSLLVLVPPYADFHGQSKTLTPLAFLVFSTELRRK